MHAEKLRQTISAAAMVVGLLLGSAQILVVSYMWLETQTFGFAGASFSVVGVVLIGLSLWQHVGISLGSKGVSAEFALKYADTTQGLGANTAMIQGVLEVLNQVRPNADPVAAKDAAAKAEELFSQNVQLQNDIKEMQGQILALLQRGNADKAEPVNSAIERTQAAIGVANDLRGVFEMMSRQHNDYQTAESIAGQMHSDELKNQLERWKILQDTQKQIFEIQQDVTANKAATQDTAYKRWDQYIRG